MMMMLTLRRWRFQIVVLIAIFLMLQLIIFNSARGLRYSLFFDGVEEQMKVNMQNEQLRKLQAAQVLSCATNASSNHHHNDDDDGTGAPPLWHTIILSAPRKNFYVEQTTAIFKARSKSPLTVVVFENSSRFGMQNAPPKRLQEMGPLLEQWRFLSLLSRRGIARVVVGAENVKLPCSASSLSTSSSSSSKKMDAQILRRVINVRKMIFALKSSDTLLHLRQANKHKLFWLQVQKIDLLIALRDALAIRSCMEEVKPQYLLVLEDDAVVAPDFDRRLAEVLSDARRDFGDAEWGFLKLFYSEYFWGWRNDVPHELPLMSAAVGAMAVALVYGVCACAVSCSKVFRCDPTRRDAVRNFFSHRRNVFVMFIAFSVVAGVDLSAVGRQHILGSHPISAILQNKKVYECEYAGKSSVAHVYPFSHVEDLAAFLEGNLYTSRAVDIVVDDWQEMRGLKRLISRPHLVQHIGLWSSTRFKHHSSMIAQQKFYKFSMDFDRSFSTILSDEEIKAACPPME